jgi:hypothetical protein
LFSLRPVSNGKPYDRAYIKKFLDEEKAEKAAEHKEENKRLPVLCGKSFFLSV